MSSSVLPADEAPRGPLTARLARYFTPPTATDPDVRRRVGVLVVSAFFIALAAFVSAVPMLPLSAYRLDLAILLGGAVLIGLNPFLVRWRAPLPVVGTLFVVEILVVASILAAFDGGIRDPIFLVNFLVPWLAAVLVGPIYGFVAAGVVTLEVLVAYALERSGRPFVTSLPPDTELLLWVLGCTVVLFGVAIIAWVYEGQTLRNLRQSHARLEQTHEAMVRSEGRFRAVVQHSSDAVFMLDADGMVLYASPSAERVLGYAPDDLVGQSAFGFLHPTDAAAARGAFERLVVSRVDKPVGRLFPATRVRRPGGGWRWYEATVEDLRAEPAVGAVVAHVRDITERKRTERALRRAKDEAETLARLRAVFLANMSHEIRTPLTGIIGFSSILAAEIGGSHGEFARLIERSGRRLLDTLNSVLDLAQLEAGQLRPKSARIDVVAETAEAVRLLRPLAERKALVLTLDAPEAPVHVTADAVFIHRILNNLVGNAIKFTDEGRVDVRVEPDERAVRLVVDDTGIGIPETFRPHLFDEFAQGSSGLTREYEGNGLGLAITKRLVDLLGGQIEVASTLGEGSTFTVHLPRTA